MITRTNSGNAHALSLLRLRWGLYALLCMLFASGGYLFLRVTWEPEFALRWLILASLALVYLLLITWRGLTLNYLPDEGVENNAPGLKLAPVLFTDLGAANTLSMLRGLLIAGLAGFLFSHWPAGWLAWLPGILYIVASLGDFMDGPLARLTGHVTRLGEVLDMEFDSLGVLVAVLLVVQYEQAPTWYLLVAIARYAFVGGLWMRKRLRMPVYELTYSIRRRTLAGLQMSVIGALLLPVFDPPGTRWVSTAFGIPLLIGFLWDWFLAIGRIQETAQSARRERFLAGWSGFVVRWLAVGLIFLQRITSPDTWVDLPVLGVLEIFIASMIFLGVTGRICAILGLVSLGLLQTQSDLTSAQLFLLLAYSSLLMLGTGPFSLWAPEERLVFHRLGAAAHPETHIPEGQVVDGKIQKS